MAISFICANIQPRQTTPMAMSQAISIFTDIQPSSSPALIFSGVELQPSPSHSLLDSSMDLQPEQSSSLVMKQLSSSSGKISPPLSKLPIMSASTSIGPIVDDTAFAAEIVIQRQFNNDLNNQTSKAFTELANKLTTFLTEVYSSTAGFKRADVVSFSNGSILADTRLIFNGNSNMTEDNIRYTLENAIATRNVTLEIIAVSIARIGSKQSLFSSVYSVFRTMPFQSLATRTIMVNNSKLTKIYDQYISSIQPILPNSTPAFSSQFSRSSLMSVLESSLHPSRSQSISTIVSSTQLGHSLILSIGLSTTQISQPQSTTKLGSSISLSQLISTTTSGSIVYSSQSLSFSFSSPLPSTSVSIAAYSIHFGQSAAISKSISSSQPNQPSSISMPGSIIQRITRSMSVAIQSSRNQINDQRSSSTSISISAFPVLQPRSSATLMLGSTIENSQSLMSTKMLDSSIELSQSLLTSTQMQSSGIQFLQSLSMAMQSQHSN